MTHRITLRYEAMRGKQKKNPRNKTIKINDAANSYRVAYWRKVHRCVNILAQE